LNLTKVRQFVFFEILKKEKDSDLLSTNFNQIKTANLITFGQISSKGGVSNDNLSNPNLKSLNNQNDYLSEYSINNKVTSLAKMDSAEKPYESVTHNRPRNSFK
jgi:hypothetical protein